MRTAAMLSGGRLIGWTVLLLGLRVDGLIGGLSVGLVKMAKRGKRHERDAKRHDPTSYGDGQIALQSRSCPLEVRRPVKTDLP